MPSYFITGANRGIGLGLVKKLLQDPDNIVLAGARNPTAAQALLELVDEYPGRLTIVEIDLADPAKISSAAEVARTLLRDGLDCLINNAAISPQPFVPFVDIDLEVLGEVLRINAIAPIQVVRAFLPLIRKGHEKKIIFVSSDLGSIEYAVRREELCNHYSMAKAALNMMAHKWGVTLKNEGITVLILHPGWVDTDMGKPLDVWVAAHQPQMKIISTEESSEGCVAVIREAKLEDAPAFLQYDGMRMPW